MKFNDVDFDGLHSIQSFSQLIKSNQLESIRFSIYYVPIALNNSFKLN